MIMGSAIVIRSSIRRLFTSSCTLKPLLLKRRETVNGDVKTPRRLVPTDNNKAKGKLPPHYGSMERYDLTCSAKIAAEASTVGAQHIIAIPMVSSVGWSGTFKTKYPINGVTKSTNTVPMIKCYDRIEYGNVQPSISLPPSPS